MQGPLVRLSIKKKSYNKTGKNDIEFQEKWRSLYPLLKSSSSHIRFKKILKYLEWKVFFVVNKIGLRVFYYEHISNGLMLLLGANFVHENVVYTCR